MNSGDESAPGAVAIKPLKKAVDFSVSVPGSKSLANRALLLAGAADGVSRLREVPESDDIRAAFSVLAGLGVPVCQTAPGAWEINGNGFGFPVKSGDLDIRSSGTVGRFLPGLLAAAPAGVWRLVSTAQLARRPLAPLLDALSALGANTVRENDPDSFPLRVAAGGLRGGDVAVSAASSSQFASGVLMAAPLAAGPAAVSIRDLDPEEAYIDLTLDLMRRFGVDASSSEKSGSAHTVRFPGGKHYRAADFAIEADYNSALYFLSLPVLLGGKATVENLPADSGQPGRKFLDVLVRLGGTVSTAGGVVSVSGHGLPLRGGFDIDMRAMSEMALTLGVLAVFADAPVTMTNLAHIRGHETDRLAVLASLLEAVGAPCEQGPDWIRVIPVPPERLRSAVIDSHDDHRFVMSFALLGLAGNGLTITNPGAVAKTFPDFFRRLAVCGAEISAF